MQNKRFTFGPVFLAATVGNLLNPPTASGGVNAGSSSQYIIIRHLHIANVTASSATFTLYKDSTGGSTAGKEFAKGKSVPANDYTDMYGEWRFDAADFLTGLASAGSTLTISGEGEIGVAG